MYCPPKLRVASGSVGKLGADDDVVLRAAGWQTVAGILFAVPGEDEQIVRDGRGCAGVYEERGPGRVGSEGLVDV